MTERRGVQVKDRERERDADSIRTEQRLKEKKERWEEGRKESKKGDSARFSCRLQDKTELVVISTTIAHR